MPVVTKTYKNVPIWMESPKSNKNTPILDGIPKIKQKYPISPQIIHSSFLIRLDHYTK